MARSFRALATVTLNAQKDSATWIALSKNGNVIRITVNSVPYNEKAHGRVRLDGTIPQSILADLQVSVDNRDLRIPHSEYEKFGDPNIGSDFIPLKIEEDENGNFYIYLSGSDGAGSHRRRIVCSESEWLRTEHQDRLTGGYVTRE